MTVSSVMPVKHRVRVYNAELLQEVVQANCQAKAEEPDAGPPSSKRAQQSSSPQDVLHNQSDSLQRRIARNKLQKWRELNRVGELTRKQLEHTMQRLSKQREADFQATFDELRRGLNSKEGIVEEVDELLRHTQRAQQKRKAALYAEWDVEVYQKIRGRIQASLAARSTGEIEARLARLYQGYLDTVNAKQGVFRDTVIEADYDPFEARRYIVRVPTGDVRDPVKRDLQKAQRERALLRGSGAARAASAGAAGRATLATVLWDRLDATPCGHHMSTEGEYICTPMTAADVALRRSRVVFEDYQYPQGDEGRAVMMAENTQNGMLKQVDGPEVRAGRRNLFGVMQCGGGDPYKEHHPRGDLWLQSMWSQGKATAPGPEVVRGRADLSETLLQLSNPYADGRSVGDQWLEARGKQRVPGPEMRRGRRDMFGTIQQATAPVQDRPQAVATGDRWIEDLWSKGKGTIDAAAIPGHRDMTEMLAQRYPNPYKSHDPRERIGDTWLTAKGKAADSGARVVDNDMGATLRGDSLPVCNRAPVGLHTLSHLEAKDTVHPSIGGPKMLPVKTAFTASHLLQEQTIHPR